MKMHYAFIILIEVFAAASEITNESETTAAVPALSSGSNPIDVHDADKLQSAVGNGHLTFADQNSDPVTQENGSNSTLSHLFQSTKTATEQPNHTSSETTVADGNHPQGKNGTEETVSDGTSEDTLQKATPTDLAPETVDHSLEASSNHTDTNESTEIDTDTTTIGSEKVDAERNHSVPVGSDSTVHPTQDSLNRNLTFPGGTNAPSSPGETGTDVHALKSSRSAPGGTITGNEENDGTGSSTVTDAVVTPSTQRTESGGNTVTEQVVDERTNTVGIDVTRLTENGTITSGCNYTDSGMNTDEASTVTESGTLTNNDSKTERVGKLLGDDTASKLVTVQDLNPTVSTGDNVTAIVEETGKIRETVEPNTGKEVRHVETVEANRTVDDSKVPKDDSVRGADLTAESRNETGVFEGVVVTFGKSRNSSLVEYARNSSADPWMNFLLGFKSRLETKKETGGNKTGKPGKKGGGETCGCGTPVCGGECEASSKRRSSPKCACGEDHSEAKGHLSGNGRKSRSVAGSDAPDANPERPAPAECTPNGSKKEAEVETGPYDYLKGLLVKAITQIFFS